MSKEREPLLSDNMIRTGGDMDNPRGMTALNVRAYYEDLITSGKLMVVKEARVILGYCLECYFDFADAGLWHPDLPQLDDEVNFCPGCGAKIIR